MKKIHIGILVILLGVCVIAFPFGKEAFESGRQQKLLQEFKQEAMMEADRKDTDEDTEEVTSEREELKNVIGILKIPAIDLEQPILNCATERNLAVSLAAVEDAAELGETGNFAIAGHSSRAYGRHFNRLPELKEGDEITVETLKGSYSYQVTGSFIAEAADTWVLDNALEGAEITLITCHYPKDGDTQRLIIKGARI